MDRQAKKRGKKHLVVVAMSGGVDSSVAALLLKRQGYNVIGIFMRCYNLDGCAEKDAVDARRVAEEIGIPFFSIDFEEEYKKQVVDYMIDGYKSGITPNPDVMCNREIKFGLLYDKAISMGADYLATGHYARIIKQKGKIGLYSAVDGNKDQTYFLWAVQPDRLKHCLFPIGEYEKSEVRKIAKKAGLSTAEKKDSQGICFLGEVNMEDFLRKSIGDKKGPITTSDGRVIGEHKGAHYYTIGQRHGLNLSSKVGVMKNSGKKETSPHYVISKNISANTVVVADLSEEVLSRKKEIKIKNINILSQEKEWDARKIFARVRYRQPLVPAMFSWISRGRSARIIFQDQIKFAAPGQSAVFYSEEGEMIGGGVIVG